MYREISIYYNDCQKRPEPKELMCIISMGSGDCEGWELREGEGCSFDSVSCQMNLGPG